MIPMKPELQNLCSHVISGVVNGVYQGAFITWIVALALRGWGRANAATRHAVWFAVLLLIVLLIPAHWLLDRAVLNQLGATAPGLGQNATEYHGIPARIFA